MNVLFLAGSSYGTVQKLASLAREVLCNMNKGNVEAEMDVNPRQQVLSKMDEGRVEVEIDVNPRPQALSNMDKGRVEVEMDVNPMPQVLSNMDKGRVEVEMDVNPRPQVLSNMDKGRVEAEMDANPMPQVLSNMDEGRVEVEMDVTPRHRDRRDRMSDVPHRMSDGPPIVPSRRHSIRSFEVDYDEHDEFFMETCPPPERMGSFATVEITRTTSEVEIEAAILARIPAHIRDQLSQEEWRQILDPDSMGFEDEVVAERCSITLCSDITDDISQHSPKPKPEAISDALYCKEEERKSIIWGDPIIATEAEQADDYGRRRISFGKVQVRTFERILEVHPCTSSGPSLGLGWMYEDEDSPQTIDWLKPNKGASQLRMCRDERECLVREELGYTSREVALAIRECLKIKNQRRRTINNLKECNSIMPVERVEYMVERCHRQLRNIQKRFLVPNVA
jgi:hypothetical protein